MRLYIFIGVAAAAILSFAAADSRECSDKLANIVINLNGPFFTKDQIIRIIDDMGTMYLQGTPLADICRYLRNSQSTYCTTEQINIVADITKQINQIIGSSERTAQLFNISFSEALSFISADQRELDQLIATEKAQGLDTDTLKRDMCRFIISKYTQEKRVEMAKRILGYVTPEHRVQIRNLLGSVIKLDGIDINDVGTTPAGFQGF